MKNVSLIIMCVVPLLLLSCSSRDGNNKGNALRVLMKDSVEVSAPQRMPVAQSKSSVPYGGKTYAFAITSRPDDSLPLVEDQQGGIFVDNRISLHITVNGKEFLNKDFTKNDFSTVLDARFLESAILEGIVYTGTSAEGLVYAASVSYPQSDLYVPVRITVTPGGKILMVKEELLEDFSGAETVD